jgi:hypothetical protein
VNLASACRARALLFTALGDVAAVRQQVEEGLDAARRARDPLRAVRLRLQLAEVLVAEGRSDEARALIARLARIDTRRLPAVVSRPLQRVVRGEPVHRAARLAAAFPSAPASTVPAPSLASRASLVDAVIDVLMVCQDVEDDRDALRKTAAAVRGRVRAASVACVAWDQEQAVVLANDGGAQPSEWVARRAAESGLVIPPSASRTGLEAAVPVRFAGTLIGAVACRWAADVPPDWPQAGALLAAASAAAGPCLRAAIDRRAAPTGDAASLEILGVSEAVRQLRADIARAAAAPFNVLVEGESGSGKELVARAMHRLGPRAHRPLCALNCAALTDDLVEAELFGHARGAFTGAIGERKGLFEEAHLGTLVLDEVGE